MTHEYIKAESMVNPSRIGAINEAYGKTSIPGIKLPEFYMETCTKLLDSTVFDDMVRFGSLSSQKPQAFLIEPADLSKSYIGNDPRGITYRTYKEADQAHVLHETCKRASQQRISGLKTYLAQGFLKDITFALSERGELYAAPAHKRKADDINDISSARIRMLYPGKSVYNLSANLIGTDDNVLRVAIGRYCPQTNLTERFTKKDLLFCQLSNYGSRITLEMVERMLDPGQKGIEEFFNEERQKALQLKHLGGLEKRTTARSLDFEEMQDLPLANLALAYIDDPLSVKGILNGEHVFMVSIPNRQKDNTKENLLIRGPYKSIVNILLEKGRFFETDVASKMIPNLAYEQDHFRIKLLSGRCSAEKPLQLDNIRGTISGIDIKDIDMGCVEIPLNYYCTCEDENNELEFEYPKTLINNYRRLLPKIDKAKDIDPRILVDHLINF